MKHIARSLAVLSAPAVLCGCVYWTEPLETRIIDASTSQPIANARVAAWPEGREKRAETFVADASGHVAIPSLKFFDPRPGDPGLSFPLSLRVDAEGYVPVDQSGLWHGDSIQLTPAEPSDDAQ